MPLLVLLALLSAAPKKKPKPPPPPTPAVAADIKRTLDAAEAKVGACVLDNAPPGPISMKVKATLTLNSAGQLLGRDLALAPENEKTKACIAAILDGLTWPKANAPLVKAEREWSFEAK
ncbi:MAG TPA: hypothetical protein VGE37_13520 [Archangium sp.]